MKEIIYHKCEFYNGYKIDSKNASLKHPLRYLANFLFEEIGSLNIDALITWLIENRYNKIAHASWPVYSVNLDNGIFYLNSTMYDNRDNFIACNTFKSNFVSMLDALKKYKVIASIRPHPNKIIFTEDDFGKTIIRSEN